MARTDTNRATPDSAANRALPKIRRPSSSWAPGRGRAGPSIGPYPSSRSLLIPRILHDRPRPHRPLPGLSLLHPHPSLDPPTTLSSHNYPFRPDPLLPLLYPSSLDHRPPSLLPLPFLLTRYFCPFDSYYLPLPTDRTTRSPPALQTFFCPYLSIRLSP